MTRKLRNKLSTSPPPTPTGGQSSNGAHVDGGTTPSLLGGPCSLCVDDMSSPPPSNSPTPQAFNPYKYTVVFDPYCQAGGREWEGSTGLHIHGLRLAVKLSHSPEMGTDMKVSDRAIVKAHEIEEDAEEGNKKNKRAMVYAPA